MDSCSRCTTSIRLGDYVLAFLIIVGATNAVNLTDGLDGLASGTSAVAAIAFSVIGLMAASMTNSIGAESVAYFGAIVAAVCLGFLVYNVNPAKVFMGDTGSLALGGAFAAMAILTKTELLLVVIGGILLWKHYLLLSKLFPLRHAVYVYLK